MKTLSMIIGVGIMIACLMSAAFAQQVPQILNFQGQLTTSAGQPVADGNYSVQFLMYTVATGGTAVWNQTQTVTAKNGVFNVLLSNVTIDPNAAAYYLTMKVGTDAEMSPRMRIVSVLYALNADKVDGIEGSQIVTYSANGNVGIGTTNPALAKLVVDTENTAAIFGKSSPIVASLTINPNIAFNAYFADNGWKVFTGGKYTGAIGLSSADGALIIALGNAPVNSGDPVAFQNRILIGNNGNTTINGTLYVTGADLAEPFDMTDIAKLELGDVVIIDPDNPLHVTKSRTAYDTTVAGIVSSTTQAGYVAGSRSDGTSDKPIALVGRVRCNVSAENGAIRTGDLLTTADTPGYAMKATDAAKRQGAILGKALQAFDGDQGQIMVLVTLQ